MRRRWSLAIAGLILAGGVLAHLTQSSGGIQIRDLRFASAKGNIMSALLYIPPNATAQTSAPGVLAVHGYINSREPDPGFVPLSTIVAIQFVPLLAIAAIIATFTWRRTGSSLPGTRSAASSSPGTWWRARPPRRRSRTPFSEAREPLRRQPVQALQIGGPKLKDGLKLNNALAFARAFAVL
jgi:hypothetical protein